MESGRSGLPPCRVPSSLIESDRVASYLKTQFPAKQVYASHGYRALQPVTSGRLFDSSHHLSNVVVYPSSTPAR